jgi:hypothetical protein
MNIVQTSFVLMSFILWTVPDVCDPGHPRGPRERRGFVVRSEIRTCHLFRVQFYKHNFTFFQRNKIPHWKNPYTDVLAKNVIFYLISYNLK